MGSPYVCSCATLQCGFGAAPLPLMALALNPVLIGATLTTTLFFWLRVFDSICVF